MCVWISVCVWIGVLVCFHKQCWFIFPQSTWKYTLTNNLQDNAVNTHQYTVWFHCRNLYRTARTLGAFLLQKSLDKFYNKNPFLGTRELSTVSFRCRNFFVNLGTWHKIPPQEPFQIFGNLLHVSAAGTFSWPQEPLVSFHCRNLFKNFINSKFPLQAPFKISRPEQLVSHGGIFSGTKYPKSKFPLQESF